jgi:tryptophanyl-tRNA synthetase
MAMVETGFSGVQPTGNLHLGNYLSHRQFRQTAGNPQLPVAWSTCTPDQPVECGAAPAELARNTREVTAAFIASGIDKEASCSNKEPGARTRNWPGSSIAWRGSAGSTA